METKDEVYRPLIVIAPSQNQDYLAILKDETQKADLGGLEIELFSYQSRLPSGITWHTRHPASSVRVSEGRYRITLKTPPDEPIDEIRRYIRHEIAHIKHGDCDRELPRILRALYNKLVAEQRANRYMNKN